MEFDDKEEMKQGTEYTASDVEKANSDIFSNEEEATSKKFKFSPKLLGIGVAVIAVFIIIVVFLGRNKSSKPVANPTAIPTQTTVSLPTEPVTFSYTLSEVISLRSYGYTGDEIETYESEETDVQTLIDAAIELQQKTYLETIAPVYQSESDAYKELKDMTWISGDELRVNPDEVVQDVKVYRSNFDYKKVPSHGKQLYIRITMDDGSYMFMSCNAEQYSRLEDAGNIVVEYTVYIYETFEVITEIKEFEL